MFSIIDQQEIQKVSKDIKVIRNENKKLMTKTKTGKISNKAGQNIPISEILELQG